MEVGPTPIFVRGCSLPIAQWRLAVQFEHGKVRSEYGEHNEALLGRNTFPQGVSGKAVLRMPRGWIIEPAQWPINAGKHENLRLPMLMSFPVDANLGPFRAELDFEIQADRAYRFTVLLPYQLGLGDVNLELQAVAVRALEAARQLEVQPARTFVNLYARNWLAETPQSLLVYPSWKKSTPETRPKFPHVGPEKLLAACPRGAWLAVLEPQLALAVKTAEARLVIISDNIDRLPSLLSGFSVREKLIAAELANAYLPVSYTHLTLPTNREV